MISATFHPAYSRSRNTLRQHRAKEHQKNQWTLTTKMYLFALISWNVNTIDKEKWPKSLLEVNNISGSKLAMGANCMLGCLIWKECACVVVVWDQMFCRSAKTVSIFLRLCPGMRELMMWRVAKFPPGPDIIFILPGPVDWEAVLASPDIDILAPLYIRRNTS